VAEKKPVEQEASELEQRRGASEPELQVHVPAGIRDVSFPLAVRGYSRLEVDDYVKQVNQLIAELEMRSSPRAAVRHALDRAAQEVSGILERAQESADELTASARREAEESTARASADAAKLLVDASDEADRARAEGKETLERARSEAEELLSRTRAEAEEISTQARGEASERLRRSEKELSLRQELAEARMRGLQADTESVWEERREVLEDIQAMAVRLEGLAREAAARSLQRAPDEQEDEKISGPEVAEPAGDGVVSGEAPTQVMPAVEQREAAADDSDEEPP
jgi:DivIVA domain-containing protein